MDSALSAINATCDCNATINEIGFFIKRLMPNDVQQFNILSVSRHGYSLSKKNKSSIDINFKLMLKDKRALSNLMCVAYVKDYPKLTLKRNNPTDFHQEVS